MKLGFAVKVLGKDGLKSHDARRWQNSPHLKNSIEYAHGIFDYLEENQITMYRFSSDFAPYLTHPEMPQFHAQLTQAREELENLGKRAQKLNLRLSFHPSQYILLNSPNETLIQTSMRDFAAQAQMLDIMGCGPEGVIVTHVGGVYGDRDAAIARFIENHKRLDEASKRRLVLENDDKSYTIADTMKIHEATGIRLIFDHQHHTCIHPEGLSHAQACLTALNTWPDTCRPKVHHSSPRLENREILRMDKESGKKKAFEAAPLLSQHADYVDAPVFIDYVRAVRALGGREFDVMIEAKSKDLALLKLREELKGLDDFLVE